MLSACIFNCNRSEHHGGVGAERGDRSTDVLALGDRLGEWVEVGDHRTRVDVLDAGQAQQPVGSVGLGGAEEGGIDPGLQGRASGRCRQPQEARITVCHKLV